MSKVRTIGKLHKTLNEKAEECQKVAIPHTQMFFFLLNDRKLYETLCLVDLSAER